MVIPQQRLKSALQRLDPSWKLRGARPLSRRAAMLEVSDAANRRQRLILLSHSASDRKRNPQIARDEFRALQQLHEAGLPVARPLYYEQSQEPPFLITTLVEGASRTDAAAPSALCAQLAAALTRIHAVDLRRHNFAFLPQQKALIRQRLRGGAADARIVSALEGALHRIPMNRRALLHGDFWLGNLLWQGERLSGILDWEDAMTGDPLGDLGKSRLEILWALGAEAMTEYTANYLALNRALDATALPFWDLWGALRLSQFPAFVTNPEQIPVMRAKYEAFVRDALQALDRLQE